MRFQTNSTTMPTMIAKVIQMLLTAVVPHRLRPAAA
jgi:hypothetical protein